MIKKLISMPKKILEKLKDFKEKTGISANSYMRNAIVRQMIADGLINITPLNLSAGRERKIKIETPPEDIKYCNGDSCSIQPGGCSG